MERCLSMRQFSAKLLVFIALALMGGASSAEQTVVLVTSKDSPIEALTALEIRKAYFGISVTIGGRSINAIRLRGDKRLNQIFLQSVIAMSDKSYERRLLSMALKYGRPRPREASNVAELVASISTNSPSIGYMWKSDADQDARVKIIRVLWQES